MSSQNINPESLPSSTKSNQDEGNASKGQSVAKRFEILLCISPNSKSENFYVFYARRLQKELMALMMSTEKSVSAFPENENFFRWIGTITGRENGKLCKFKLIFFCFQVPKIQFTMGSDTDFFSSFQTLTHTHRLLYTSSPNVSTPILICKARCVSISLKKNGPLFTTSGQYSSPSSRFSENPTTRVR